MGRFHKSLLLLFGLVVSAGGAFAESETQSLKQLIALQQATIEQLKVQNTELSKEVKSLQDGLAEANQAITRVQTSANRSVSQIEKKLRAKPFVLLKHSSNDCPPGYSRIAWLGSIQAGADGYGFGQAHNWALCSRKY
jgi:cell division protein FtsB